jgi:nitroreductase
LDERLAIIYARRSIRRYSPEPVGDELTRELLEAAMAAPSASNLRPWHFVTITDRSRLQELADAHPHGKMLPQARLAIAVCGDPEISKWWVQDCTAATENILIAAAGLGLGAVWLGVQGRPEREDAVRRILSIPPAVGVLSLISMGWPAEQKESRTQFDPDRVHREAW